MEKPQFDELLGGDLRLPRDVQICRLAAARASEIAAMTYSIENPQHTKLLFQKLPVHMRRRVMSHNAKRMPRRLRIAHTRQMEKSGMPPKSKRPSRRYRRRPKNLLLEYNRRQRNKQWLETHIWHAKRFHMCEKWGYKIANYPNDRGHRANYRAVAKHCMIQDISYYVCIELRGLKNLMVEKLNVHCKDQLTFGAKVYLSGGREGSLTFYKRDNTPVGIINFMWKPNGLEQTAIWIWIHPALLKDVSDELLFSFELKEILDDSRKSSRVFESSKFGCRMEILNNSLNRFRIRGPLTTAVLTDTLKLPSMSKMLEDSKTDVLQMEVDSTEQTIVPWYASWYKNPEHNMSFQIQENSFTSVKTLNSPNQLPRHSIMALTVLDPRFFIPEKRTKKMTGPDHYETIFKFPLTVSDSPLWIPDVREKVKADCKSTNEINKLRSGNLVPGIHNDSEFDEKIISKVPVILVQYPGTDTGGKSLGFTSGIDIILPAGWALPFWLALMYRCARPAGLREYKSVIFENLMLNSPEINHPDTQAYLCEAAEIRQEMKTKYFRYPPNRRVNFTKFSISSPFYCEWKMLVNEWTNEDRIHVLRDQKIIRMLDQTFNNFPEQQGRKRKINSTILKEKFDRSILQQLKSSLVLVKVTIEGRGRPKNFSLICKPTKEDLEKFSVDRSWSGPVQKLKTDEFEERRKSTRQNHKVFMKRAMRERSRVKKLEKPSIKYQSGEEKIKFAKIMEELYLPECKAVKNSCDREVMGYVVQGDFSFTESRGVGWGYVVAQTLLELIDRESSIVLIRNTQTRQYRRAKISIVNLNP